MRASLERDEHTSARYQAGQVNGASDTHNHAQINKSAAQHQYEYTSQAAEVNYKNTNQHSAVQDVQLKNMYHIKGYLVPGGQAVVPAEQSLPDYKIIPVDEHATSYNTAWNVTVMTNCTTNSSEDCLNSTLSEASHQGATTLNHPVVGILLTFFAIVTVVGNILVILAVAKERYLRTVTNYFIVSLALADLIIGAVVMPFSISLEVTSNIWLFGTDWCDVWHSFDVLASTASILNLSVIALDRYWAITDPIAYPSKMTTGRTLVLTALVWICSAAISFPAILWWRTVTPHPPEKDTCFFTDDAGYLIFSSIVSFYVPVIVILFAYYKIYLAASEQTRSLKIGSKVMYADGVNGEVMMLRMHRGGANRPPSEVIHYTRAANTDSENDSPQHLLRPEFSEVEGSGDIRPSRMISRKWKHFALHRKISKLAKEQKAAKTLGIVMGVFCISWVPFFVTNVLYGICHDKCVPHAHIVFPVFTWLGYINSGMNPVIYALSMKDFRRAFTKIMFFCCPNYRFRGRRRNCTNGVMLSGSSASCNERFSNVRL